MIVVDPICSEVSVGTMNTWKARLGKESICYIQTPDKSMAEAYNEAIPEIKGTYVNFSLASTWFDAGVLEGVQYVAEERERPKMISLSPWTVNEKDEFLQYKMSPISANEVYENIRFYREPAKLQLMFHAYFIRTFLIKSESRGNVNILLNAVDMENNTFLKVEEGFDDNDMDRVFTHLKAKAHARDEYRRRLIYEEYLKNKEYNSYGADDEWQRTIDAEGSEEDREPIWVMDFKNAPRHPFALYEISSDGNLVLKSAIGSDEHNKWLKRKRERESGKKR